MFHRAILRALPAVAVVVVSFGFGALSPAAAESAQSSPVVIEEVVVTARKREEAAQDVPVAITALTSELTSSTIRNLTDVNGHAPNVNIDSSPGRTGGAAISIRGISPTRLDDNTFDSPIGVMIDGIYLGTSAGQVIENFDLERIEILRGPQGTLFGKNTVGGVVNVIRTRPTGEIGARLKYTIGKWGTAGDTRGHQHPGCRRAACRQGVLYSDRVRRLHAQHQPAGGLSAQGLQQLRHRTACQSHPLVRGSADRRKVRRQFRTLPRRRTATTCRPGWCRPRAIPARRTFPADS